MQPNEHEHDYQHCADPACADEGTALAGHAAKTLATTKASCVAPRPAMQEAAGTRLTARKSTRARDRTGTAIRHQICEEFRDHVAPPRLIAARSRTRTRLGGIKFAPRTRRQISHPARR
jgi:hypothetical protein